MSPTGDGLHKEGRYEGSPINGIIDGAQDDTMDGALNIAADIAANSTLDDTTDIAGNGILKAAMERAGWWGTDVGTEGDWDKWGMSMVTKTG